MSAIDTVLLLAEEIGHETDDVCDAIVFLADNEEIGRWPLDEQSAESMSVIKSNQRCLELRCSTPDGMITIVLETHAGGVIVTDSWYDSDY